MRVPVNAGLQPGCRAVGMMLVAGLLLASCSVSSTSPPNQADLGNPDTDVLETVSPADPVSEMDMTIVPGDRVGPVTAVTTYEDLVALYGEDVLEAVEVHQGEGMFASGTRVNQEAQSFSVVWTDESRTAVQSVREFGVAWQVEPGIGVGTPLADLQEMLGEFELYGFGWDYGGTMVLDGTPLEPYKEVLVLRLRPAIADTGMMAQYEAVMGDRLFPSDTPAFQEMDLSVGEMIVILN